MSNQPNTTTRRPPVAWESRDAAGSAIAIDHDTRTVRNTDGTTRHLDRIFVCYHDALLELLAEAIPAAPAR